MLQKDGRALRVLIMEDEALIAWDLAEMIRDAGGEVTAVATTADAALKLAAADPPDALIGDLGLGGGDGTAAIKTILGRYAGCSAVIVSGRRGEDVRELFAGMLNVRVLPKPAGAQDIVSALQDACTPRTT